VRSRIAIAALAAVLGGGVLAGGTPPETTRVAFLVDTSGSLRGDDLARAGALVSGVMDALPAGAEAALVTFDDDARVTVAPTSRREDVRAALAALRPRGRRTAMNDALFDAARLLREERAARAAIVLVTDGRDEDSAVELADGLAVAQQAGLPVFTVGVGRVEERVLRRIAKLTGGTYARLALARPGGIAAGITAAGRGAVGVTAAASSAATLPARGPAGAVGPRRQALAWLGVLAMAIGAAFFAWRRRSAADGRSVTARQDAASDAAPRSPRDAEARWAESPIADFDAATIVERMNRTEEYLEKTITLRERPVLTVTRGAGAGEVYELAGRAPLSIGRAKANEVVVNDLSVSSEHCRIRPEDGRFVLHDLKSTNGTFVNERRVTRHILSEGDILKIGETALMFRTDLKRA
jgi:uncharacterized protein YegL